MPDDTIRVGTAVDTSGLKAGQSAAQQITAQMVADLKAQYAQASARLRILSLIGKRPQSSIGRSDPAFERQRTFHIDARIRFPDHDAAQRRRPMQDIL